MGYSKIRRPIITPTGSDSNISGVGKPDDATSEFDTGRKWIDGRPIYRKILNDTGSGTYPDGNNDVAHGITNLDRMVSVEAFLARDNGDRIILPFVSVASTFNISLLIQDTVVRFNVGTSWGPENSRLSDAIIVLEYVKS